MLKIFPLTPELEKLAIEKINALKDNIKKMKNLLIQFYETYKYKYLLFLSDKRDKIINFLISYESSVTTNEKMIKSLEHALETKMLNTDNLYYIIDYNITDYYLIDMNYLHELMKSNE
jgi:hypothetical protein